ncbi:MAG: ABC transporter substrate-binding protein [Acidimicrobiia bacterium]|nr:ABC transporter substrate-binding protein [Acidimicrobiia bacterium]
MRWRRLLTVVLTTALFAAACTSSGDDEGDAAATDDAGPATSAVDSSASTTSSASTETAAPSTTLAARTASFRGVTEDTIEVGVVVSDLDELRELGLVDINRGDEQLVWQTFVDDINERGGINGRSVNMTWAPYVPTQETSALEACIMLTEDVGVFATLGGVRGPAATVNTCFVGDHETIMVGGTHVPEQLNAARAPWISDQMSAERKYSGGIGIMADEGLLDGTVGIIYDSAEEGLYNDVIEPALADVGVTPVVGVQDIPPGDLSAAQALFPVILERFAAEGVDTIMLVQAAMNLGVGILLDNGFEGQIIGLDPTSQVAAIGGYDERLPADFDGVIGITGASPDEKWDLPATQDCVATFEAANPDIDVLDSRDVPEGEADWAVPVIEACRHLALFEMVAANAGVDLTNDTFAAGLEGLGTFVLAGQPFNSVGLDKADADDSLRLGVFDSSLGDEGDLAPYTELQDIG